MLFSFFHNFVKLKLVILFSRLISFFPIFNRVMKKYKKLPIDPTPTPPTLTRTRVGRGVNTLGGYVGGDGYVGGMDTFWGGGGGVRWGDGYVGGYVGGMMVRWGGVYIWGCRLRGYILWGGVRWGDGYVGGMDTFWGGGGYVGGDGYVGGYVGGMGVRWGEGVSYVGVGTLGRGFVEWGEGGGRSWSQCSFWALFGKLLHIGRPWMNVFVRVLLKVAKIRVIILINFHGFYVQKIIHYIENKNGL